MTWPPEDTSSVIADAYELRELKGSDLLLRLGDFDLWRGNLAEMRGDSPMEPAADEGNTGDMDRFLQTLAVSRSFELLQPKCQKALRLAYVEGRNAGQLANELDISDRYAEKMVANCARHLFEAALNVYRGLLQQLDEATPDEAEREARPATPLSSVLLPNDSIPAERK